MEGSTHAAMAVLVASVGVTTGLVPGFCDKVLFCIGCYYGAMVPDVDADYSIGKNTFRITASVYGFLGKMFSNTSLQKYFVHRGIMHTMFPPLFLLFLYKHTAWPLSYLFAGISIGWLSHLLLDLPKIRNGSITEHLIRSAIRLSYICMSAYAWPLPIY